MGGGESPTPSLIQVLMPSPVRVKLIPKHQHTFILAPIGPLFFCFAPSRASRLHCRLTTM